MTKGLEIAVKEDGQIAWLTYGDKPYDVGQIPLLQLYILQELCAAIDRIEKNILPPEKMKLPTGRGE